ncbi:IPO4 [Mytilus edulis]|uniref:IPO4 n=1 Tax=Mytilus edulis TaxID=6550 RepID=A0A8S3QEP9_MYTED|nr:IPO4 [Mytilus edulis]
MLQGKTQSISDKIKLYEVETIKLQKSFMPEENLGNQCTPMLDEDQTIPKTICETILQEHSHELEQSINADINEEPQNPVYDTQPKLPLSGSRVLIAGSSVLKGIDPSKLKDYIDVHVHRGANVLDLYEDIRNMDLSSYNTIIIHVGGNDASSKMNVQQFVDIFQEIINFVRCQNCRAIVSGILPRIQCDVTEYNTILKQMCHYNDVKFISNYESFVYKDDHIAKSFYTTDGIHLNRYGTIKLLANVNKVIKVFKGKQIQHHLNQQNRNRYQSSSHQYYANNFRRSPTKPRYQSRSNMNTTDRRNFNHSGINPRNVKDRNDLNMNSRDSWENNNELNRQNVDRAPFFNYHSPNSDQACEVLEVFDEMLECEVAMLVPHMKTVVDFCIETSANDILEDKVRVKGMSFIATLIKLKKKTFLKMKLVDPVLNVLFALMCGSGEEDNSEEEEEDLDSYKPAQYAPQVIDTVALHLPPEKLIPNLMQLVEPLISSENPLVRRACFLSVAVVAEGCADYIIKKHLQPLLHCVVSGLNDPDQGVRNGALFAMGQFSEHLQVIQTLHTGVVVNNV